MRSQGIIIGWVIAVLGFTFGAYRLLDTWSFMSRAHEAQGIIVARDSHVFTIQFEADGQTYQIEEDLPSTRGMSGQTRMQLQVGTPVSVLYNPASPGKARWKASRLWVFPLAMIIVAIIAALCCLFPDFMSRPWRSGRSSTY
jgi:hypothetical protein